MGNKLERQNQHQKRIKSKIKRFEKRGWSTDGLKKELSYSTGEATRPEFISGHAAGDIKAQEKFAMIRLKRQQVSQS